MRKLKKAALSDNGISSGQSLFQRRSELFHGYNPVLVRRQRVVIGLGSRLLGTPMHKPLKN
jgi:hypothetical protein